MTTLFQGFENTVLGNMDILGGKDSFDNLLAKIQELNPEVSGKIEIGSAKNENGDLVDALVYDGDVIAIAYDFGPVSDTKDTGAVDYGTVDFDGETYKLTDQADFTNRCLPYNPDNDLFEMSAPAVDEDGNEVTVYWIFREIPDAELDTYDYDDVDRVEEN